MKTFTLHELDIQSRAAAALVEDWQGPHKVVRAIWKLEDVISFLVTNTASAQGLQRTFAEQEGADEGDHKALTDKLSYFLESIQRLRSAAENVLRIVEMFESEGYAVSKADDLRTSLGILPQIIEQIDALQENLEWRRLEKELIPNERLIKIHEYLSSSGQASA
jgi:hypothetical protein